jgi:predicted alpha/beta hydrolase family esterase
MSFKPTVVVVPGLRDEAPGHWQSLLARDLERVSSLPALGQQNIDLAARVAAIETAVRAVDGPVIVVAHSGGAIAAAHWAQQTQARNVLGAVLATPPVFAAPLGPDYPPLEQFEEQGWLPLPNGSLPVRTIVAASRNDALGSYEQVAELARRWGAELVDLGEVGHLNPASGYGPWPGARTLIERLAG